MTMTVERSFPTPADVINASNKASKAKDEYIDYFTEAFVEEANKVNDGAKAPEESLDANQESTQERAKEAFNAVYIEMEDVSRQIQALLDQADILRNKFTGLENDASQLAIAAGSEYIPDVPVADEVVEPVVDEPQPKETKKIDVVEVKQEAKQQNHVPSDAEQVFIDATRTQDDISRKANLNTAPDERKHRRVSYDPSDPLATVNAVEPGAATSEPNVKPETVSQPKASDTEVQDAIDETQAREFASFEDYIAHIKTTGAVEGMYQLGDRHHDAKTGNFVSKQAFEDYRDAPVVNTVRYYDDQNSIDNKDKVFESPDYAGMTIVELAREAGKIEYTNPGDGKNIDSEIMKIRDVAKAKYLEAAQASGDEDALKHYEESMEEFSSLSSHYTDSIYDKEPKTEVEAIGLKEKVKAWIGKERKKWQEFHGLIYMGSAFSGALGKAGDWLTSRHINEETMTPEEIQSQRLINRRHNMMGFAAGVVVGLLAQKTGVIFDAFTPPSAHTVDALGLGENGYHYPVPIVEPGHVDGGGFVPHLPDAAVGMDVNGVDNPAYNIPNGGGGEALFHDLNLSASQWKEHAQELLKQFPTVLYPENGDVRFAQVGTPPIEFREAIEKIRNS